MISRWVFGSLLTARYSGSSETIFEQDLARVARLGPDDADGFVRALDDAIGETLTGDYWTQSLVSALETQKARAPAALAFRAAQVVLGTRRFFLISFFGTCSTRRRMAGARLAKPTTSFRWSGSIHAVFGSGGALTRSPTWRTLAGTRTT